jgi:hypothetical protein
MQELIQAGANVNTPVSYTGTSGDCDWRIESTVLMYAVKHIRYSYINNQEYNIYKNNQNIIEALLK